MPGQRSGAPAQSRRRTGVRGSRVLRVGLVRQAARSPGCAQQTNGALISHGQCCRAAEINTRIYVQLRVRLVY